MSRLFLSASASASTQMATHARMESMAIDARAKIIRGIILDEVYAAVKDLVQEKEKDTEGDVTLYGCMLTDRLTSGIDAMFLHGLREDAEKAKHMWELFRRCAHRHVVTDILSEPNLTTFTGRCRAFTRDLVNTPGAPLNLSKLFTQEKDIRRLVKKLYKEYAMVRDEGDMMKMITKLERLQVMFTFQLRLTHPCLNRWPCLTLQLAGLESGLVPRHQLTPIVASPLEAEGQKSEGKQQSELLGIAEKPSIVNFILEKRLQDILKGDLKVPQSAATGINMDEIAKISASPDMPEVNKVEEKKVEVQGAEEEVKTAAGEEQKVKVAGEEEEVKAAMEEEEPSIYDVYHCPDNDAESGEETEDKDSASDVVATRPLASSREETEEKKRVTVTEAASAAARAKGEKGRRKRVKSMGEHCDIATRVPIKRARTKGEKKMKKIAKATSLPTIAEEQTQPAEATSLQSVLDEIYSSLAPVKAASRSESARAVRPPEPPKVCTAPARMTCQPVPAAKTEYCAPVAQPVSSPAATGNGQTEETARTKKQRRHATPKTTAPQAFANGENAEEERLGTRGEHGTAGCRAASPLLLAMQANYRIEYEDPHRELGHLLEDCHSDMELYENARNKLHKLVAFDERMRREEEEKKKKLCCLVSFVRSVVVTFRKTFNVYPKRDPAKERLIQEHFVDTYCYNNRLTKKPMPHPEVKGKCGVCLENLGDYQGRLCHLSGQLCCRRCHRSKRAIIPYNLMHDFDFNKYEVCNAAWSFLKEEFTNPWIEDFCRLKRSVIMTKFGEHTSHTVFLRGKLVCLIWQIRDNIKKVRKLKCPQELAWLTGITPNNIYTIRKFSVEELLMVKNKKLPNLLTMAVKKYEQEANMPPQDHC